MAWNEPGWEAPTTEVVPEAVDPNRFPDEAPPTEPTPINRRRRAVTPRVAVAPDGAIIGAEHPRVAKLKAALEGKTLGTVDYYVYQYSPYGGEYIYLFGAAVHEAMVIAQSGVKEEGYTYPDPVNKPWLRLALGGKIVLTPGRNDNFINSYTDQWVYLGGPIRITSLSDVTALGLVGGHATRATFTPRDRANNTIDYSRPNWSRPFIYAPKYIHSGGKVWAITEKHQKQLYLECEVRGYHGAVLNGMGASDIRLVDPTDNTEVLHFHKQCWGHDGFEVTCYQNRGHEDLSLVPHEKLAARLDTINIDSLNTREFRGLTSGQIYDAAIAYPPLDAAWAQAARTIRHAGLGLEIPDSIVVLGVGGVGFHAGVMAGMVGIKQVCAIDMDSLAEHNRNRLYLSGKWAGKPKVDGFAAFMKNTMDTDAPHVQKWLSLDEHNKMCKAKHDALLDCTDNLPTQQQAWQYCQAQSMRYVRAGYDGGHHVTITGKQPPGWDIHPELTYTTPSWIAGAQIAASLALVKLVSAPDMEATFDIRHIQGGEHEQEGSSLPVVGERDEHPGTEPGPTVTRE